MTTSELCRYRLRAVGDPWTEFLVWNTRIGGQRAGGENYDNFYAFSHRTTILPVYGFYDSRQYKNAMRKNVRRPFCIRYSISIIILLKN